MKTRKKLKWIAFADQMPPHNQPIFFGARVHTLWRFYIALLSPDATQQSIAMERIITHWAEVPNWILKGPVQLRRPGQ